MRERRGFRQPRTGPAEELLGMNVLNPSGKERRAEHVKPGRHVSVPSAIQRYRLRLRVNRSKP